MIVEYDFGEEIQEDVDVPIEEYYLHRVTEAPKKQRTAIPPEHVLHDHIQQGVQSEYASKPLQKVSGKGSIVEIEVLHVMHLGSCLCGRADGPDTWPPSMDWVSFESWANDALSITRAEADALLCRTCKVHGEAMAKRFMCPGVGDFLSTKNIVNDKGVCTACGQHTPIDKAGQKSIVGFHVKPPVAVKHG